METKANNKVKRKNETRATSFWCDRLASAGIFFYRLQLELPGQKERVLGWYLLCCIVRYAATTFAFFTLIDIAIVVHRDDVWLTEKIP
jgi:hypothetical protein